MNGTMKPMSEYDKTGSWTGDAGTETNPYAVEDVYDFCAIEDGADVNHYMLVRDIDFNNHKTYKMGVFPHQVVSCQYAVLHGEGHAVRNIYVTNITLSENVSHGMFSLASVENCKFENIIMGTTFLAYRYVFGNTSFVNCSFYCQLNSASFNSLFTANTFTNCSFNFAGLNSDNELNLNINTFVRCHMNFKKFTTPTSDTYISGKYYSRIFQSVNFTNVYFTGEINISYAPRESIIFIYQGTISNIYFCININCGADRKFVITNAPQTTCFFNKDLITGVKEVTGNTKFYALTDEQCRDVDYLSNVIGFPVVGV